MWFCSQQGEFCTYHVQSAYKKHSAKRSELQAGYVILLHGNGLIIYTLQFIFCNCDEMYSVTIRLCLVLVFADAVVRYSM